jgi:GDP-L-fucose synthase
MPTAIVTGGCGFVGRHFVRRLLDLGWHVTVVDDLSAGLAPEKWPEHLKPRPGEAKQIEFNLVDFRSYLRSRNADFDLIAHLAAVVGGRLTIDGDPLKVATDLAIDADMFNWVVKTKPLPRKVLCFSSSAAYPIHLQTAAFNRQLKEEDIDFGEKMGVPDMTYGWSKLTAEFLAIHAAKTYGLDVVAYRPFSGYGEDQDFTYPFPSIIRRVGNRETPLVVWGSGRQLRDFIYIDDCVDAVFATMNKMQPGESLNLGSGVGTTFKQLAEIAGGVIGHHATVINDATKPEGVFARVCDPTNLFRWYKPTTSLEQGIRKTYEHQLRSGLLTPAASR